ncbi:MAG: SCP2 sterol-binding domain-containing protein [Firmicutes bacterium]|nr:SCP2 sterol-binding domain-containing protein [Bacillota bacterium]
MYFEEAFEKIKTSLQKTKIKASDNHFAIQVRMTDYDCGGTFYIEQKEGKFFVEPYNYFDFDADVEASFKDIKDIADGKLDMKKAVDDGKLIISGNLEELLGYADKLKKTEKKTVTKSTVKKATTKKTEKKAEPEKKTVKKDK